MSRIHEVMKQKLDEVGICSDNIRDWINIYKELNRNG